MRKKSKERGSIDLRSEDVDRSLAQEPPAKKVTSHSGTVNIAQIETDLKRFSYQVTGDRRNAYRLLDVQVFDPILAGVVSVWFSPDQRLWLVDGYQRLGLAKRLRVAQLNAQVFDSGGTYRGAVRNNFDEVACRAFAALMNLHKNNYEINLERLTKDLDEAIGALQNTGDYSRSLCNRLSYLLSLSRVLLLRADGGDMRWSYGHTNTSSRRNMLAEIRKLLASKPENEFLASEVKSELGVDASHEKTFYSALAKLHNSHQIVRVSRARYKTGILRS